MTEPTKISGSIKAVTFYEVIKGVGAVITALALWAWHNDVSLWIQSANKAWVQHFGTLFSTQVRDPYLSGTASIRKLGVVYLIYFWLCQPSIY